MKKILTSLAVLLGLGVAGILILDKIDPDFKNR